MTDNTNTKQPYFPKLFDMGGFSLRSETLSSKQALGFWLFVIVTLVGRIILIPYNMMDIGDSATRVWNALMWAEHPFFVMPVSGHPFWFYMMGPVLMVTKEIFYTPAIVMILLMTVAGYYIFKTTLMLADFKTAFIAFAVFIVNPVIFRLNYEPFSQQPYLTAVCIMIYFFIKALAAPPPAEYLLVGSTGESKKYFTISGVFAFFALFTRPEAIFIIVPLCLVAFLSRKNGCCNFIFLSLFFQVFWVILSQAVYGTPFKTFQGADQYTEQIDFHGLSLGLRMKGLFLPYYFLLFGLTIFVFYYFIKGVIYFYKKNPRILLIILFIPILVPAVINGLAGAKSPIYHSTGYMYLMWYFSPIFAAIGLSHAFEKFKSPALRYSLVTGIILSSVPFSYVKDFVPYKYNKLFPKVIQFIVTAEDPPETRKLIDFVDRNINMYPALIFDAESSESSIFYVPYRTMLPASPADNPLVLISGYNIPRDKEMLKSEIRNFMSKNRSGMVMVKKSGTVMSEIFSELTSKKQYIRNDFVKAEETEKWIIYLYK